MEGASKILLDAHHRATVVELAAVVRSGEDSDQLLLGEELVAVFDYLMGPADQIELVLLEEVAHDFLPEDIAHSPL